MNDRALDSRMADVHRFHPGALRFRVAVAVPLAGMILGAATTPASGRSAEPSPGTSPAFALRIGVDNGRSSVREGDRLTYTIKISNTGGAATPGLLLTQTLVPGLELVSSTPKGKVSKDRIVWRRALPAGGTRKLTVTFLVKKLSAQMRRLAAVACASDVSGKRPIVCATDSDALPALASAEADQQNPGHGLGRWPWYAAGGLVALLLASIGLYARRRRT